MPCRSTHHLGAHFLRSTSLTSRKDEFESGSPQARCPAVSLPPTPKPPLAPYPPLMTTTNVFWCCQLSSGDTTALCGWKSNMGLSRLESRYIMLPLAGCGVWGSVYCLFQFLEATAPYSTLTASRVVFLCHVSILPRCLRFPCKDTSNNRTLLGDSRRSRV